MILELLWGNGLIDEKRRAGSLFWTTTPSCSFLKQALLEEVVDNRPFHGGVGTTCKGFLKRGLPQSGGFISVIVLNNLVKNKRGGLK